jgi:hypothetical protein
MDQAGNSELGMLSTLRGIPSVDINRHTMLASRGGRSATSILTEPLRLILGPGKLNASEYFCYRLWDMDLALEQKRAFVGRKAQHPHAMTATGIRQRPTRFSSRPS